MTSPIAVCPFREDLLRRLTGKSVVLQVEREDLLSSAIQESARFQVHLHCLTIRTGQPLASLAFREEWREAPLALYAPRIGRFRDLARQLPAIRQLNLRVYLPSDGVETYVGLRILSSLGIECAVELNAGGAPWEQLSDLMTYALLGLAPHAPVEPFQFLASRYRDNQCTDYGAVYFDDPAKYLHLDEHGRVFLSPGDLLAGKCIATDIDEVRDPAALADHANRLRRQAFFLQKSGCAYCQGWRVCQGKFHREADHGCKQFFGELMDSIELYQAHQKKRKTVWQP